MIKKLFFLPFLAFGLGHAQSVVFFEDFDSGTNSQWTIGDRDGDGDTWEILNAEENELDTFTGNFAASFSWYLQAFSPDNTLTSRSIMLPNSTSLKLSWKVAAGDEDVANEHYGVYVIPASADFTGNETPVHEETLSSDTPKTVTVDISSFAGQQVKLVFRHFDTTDVYYMAIDDVKIVDNSTMSVGEASGLKSAGIVYVADKQHLMVKGTDIKDAVIYTAAGQMRAVKLGDDCVDVSAFVPGVYIFKATVNGKPVTYRFIKK